jgi:hypothetical protein
MSPRKLLSDKRNIKGFRKAIVSCGKDRFGQTEMDGVNSKKDARDHLLKAGVNLNLITILV